MGIPTMWWYREQKRPGGAAPKVTLPTPVPKVTPAALVTAIGAAMADRPREPDALLMMAILVDSCVEMKDGTKSDGVTWLEAERLLSEAVGKGEPVRLYNRFSRECGDGYTLRSDLPEGHAKCIEDLTKRLLAAPGIQGIAPRSMRKSRISEPTGQPVDIVPAPSSEESSG